jgi:diguanylate cyclase (GGDEF)-like protein
LVSLRRFALWRLTLLVMGVVSLVMGLFVWLVVSPLTHTNAQSSFMAATEGVTRSLDAMQDSTRLTLMEGRRWWQLSRPIVDDPQGFNDFFKPLLSVNPLATSVVAGQADGQGWMLLQTGENRWRNRLTHVPRWGAAQRIVLTDERGYVEVSTLVQDYDARRRPWYTAAMAQSGDDELAWTAPYTFFTTGEPGITASIRLGPLGQAMASPQDGALGLDLKLRDLSRVTMASRVGLHGLAAVLTADGRVLALPRNTTGVTDDDWARHVLQPAEQLGLMSLDAAVQHWVQAGHVALSVQEVAVQGRDWLVSAQPYDLGQQRLWVLTLAPQADFAPNGFLLWGSMLGGLVLLMFPVAWVVGRQTRQLVQPLEALARNSERIGRLEFDAIPLDITSRVKEVRQLAAAQNHMAELLDQHQNDLARQISELERARDEIHQLAYYDPLTHLPNRRLLIDRLRQSLARCQRSQHSGLLLFIDLDNFKGLNDTLGHSAGDMLLQVVAQRLLGSVRQADTVARLGGDEFLVVLEDFARQSLPDADVLTQARKAAEKIRWLLDQPATLAGTEFVITPSIGVVPFKGGEPVEHLLKWADMAMYRAKAAGRNGVCFFDPAFQAQAEWRVHMESDVRQALRDNDLQMWLQPQFNGHRQVVGAEALVRWPHARRGWVSPAEFIPVAEAAGLIVPLGEWMLAQACAQLTRWAQDPVSADWTLSVNVSARQFRHPEFIAHTVATLQDSGANPQRLRLELTESMLLDDVVQTVERMEALRALGVGFSLDDFGTGYSSLTYLKRLPFLELKVDQSFVRDMLTDPSDAVLTHTMIVLAHALGLTVLAEGVETQAQLDALQADGCDLFQGFLLGRPVAVTEFQRLWVESGQG